MKQKEGHGESWKIRDSLVLADTCERAKVSAELQSRCRSKMLAQASPTVLPLYCLNSFEVLFWRRSATCLLGIFLLDRSAIAFL